MNDVDIDGEVLALIDQDSFEQPEIPCSVHFDVFMLPTLLPTLSPILPDSQLRL